MIPSIFGNKAVFGESVRGSVHRKTGTECQDSHSCAQRTTGVGDFFILTVADGHGSEDCPYSKKGSLMAVAAFLKTMNEYCVNFADDFESLLTFLNREGDTKVAQTIEARWKRRVLKKHYDELHDESSDSDDIYRQYGCTLLGLLVTPAFFFAFQIGDGDIVYLDDAGCEHVIARERTLGTQTDSLCQRNAWKKAISVTKRRGIDDGIPYAFMLSTDGFVNSYDSIEEYKKSCVGYYSMIKEYGAVEVAKNLKKWLEETSEMGCGDDVSAVFFYAIDSGEQDDVKR